MKAQATIPTASPGPAVFSAPLYDPARERPHRGDRAPRRLEMTPIELRIGGGDGPAAIAILE